jgi:mono/diheme cytochrome c family protein
MKKILKGAGTVTVVVLTLTAVIAGAAYARAMSRVNHKWDLSPAGMKVPDDPEAAKEGERLFGARGCKKCHGADAGGVLILDVPLMGTVYGANLTRGKGSAVANYTEADWVRTVRHGVKPSGYPTQVMDSKEYQFITDRDLGLIVAYLRTVPPVDRQNPPFRITTLSYIFHGLDMLDVTSADQVDHQRNNDTVPAPSAAPEFGQYVVRLQCMQCHGDGLSGGKLSGAPGLAIPANLTPDDETGLGKWTYEQFVTAMQTGKRPDGRVLDSLMPWDVYTSMSNEELTAIWTYLRSLPPRKFGGR